MMNGSKHLSPRLPNAAASSHVDPESALASQNNQPRQGQPESPAARPGSSSNSRFNLSRISPSFNNFCTRIGTDLRLMGAFFRNAGTLTSVISSFYIKNATWWNNTERLERRVGQTQHGQPDQTHMETMMRATVPLLEAIMVAKSHSVYSPEGRAAKAEALTKIQAFGQDPQNVHTLFELVKVITSVKEGQNLNALFDGITRQDAKDQLVELVGALKETDIFKSLQRFCLSITPDKLAELMREESEVTYTALMFNSSNHAMRQIPVIGELMTGLLNPSACNQSVYGPERGGVTQATSIQQLSEPKQKEMKETLLGMAEVVTEAVKIFTQAHKSGDAAADITSILEMLGKNSNEDNSIDNDLLKKRLEALNYLLLAADVLNNADSLEGEAAQRYRSRSAYISANNAIDNILKHFPTGSSATVKSMLQSAAKYPAVKMLTYGMQKLQVTQQASFINRIIENNKAPSADTLKIGTLLTESVLGLFNGQSLTDIRSSEAELDVADLAEGADDAQLANVALQNQQHLAFTTRLGSLAAKLVEPMVGIEEKDGSGLSRIDSNKIADNIRAALKANLPEIEALLSEGDFDNNINALLDKLKLRTDSQGNDLAIGTKIEQKLSEFGVRQFGRIIGNVLPGLSQPNKAAYIDQLSDDTLLEMSNWLNQAYFQIGVAPDDAAASPNLLADVVNAALTDRAHDDPLSQQQRDFKQYLLDSANSLLTETTPEQRLDLAKILMSTVANSAQERVDSGERDFKTELVANADRVHALLGDLIAIPSECHVDAEGNEVDDATRKKQIAEKAKQALCKTENLNLILALSKHGDLSTGIESVIDKLPLSKPTNEIIKKNYQATIGKLIEPIQSFLPHVVEDLKAGQAPDAAQQRLALRRLINAIPSSAFVALEMVEDNKRLETLSNMLVEANLRVDTEGSDQAGTLKVDRKTVDDVKEKFKEMIGGVEGNQRKEIILNTVDTMIRNLQEGAGQVVPESDSTQVANEKFVEFCSRFMTEVCGHESLAQADLDSDLEVSKEAIATLKQLFIDYFDALKPVLLHSDQKGFVDQAKQILVDANIPAPFAKRVAGELNNFHIDEMLHPIKPLLKHSGPVLNEMLVRAIPDDLLQEGIQNAIGELNGLHVRSNADGVSDNEKSHTGVVMANALRGMLTPNGKKYTDLGEEECKSIDKVVNYAQDLFSKQKDVTGRAKLVGHLMSIVQNAFGKRVEVLDLNDNGTRQEAFAKQVVQLVKDLVTSVSITRNEDESEEEFDSKLVGSVRNALKAHTEDLLPLLRSVVDSDTVELSAGGFKESLKAVLATLNLPRYLQTFIEGKLNELALGEMFVALKPFISGLTKDNVNGLIDIIPNETLMPLVSGIRGEVENLAPMGLAAPERGRFPGEQVASQLSNESGKLLSDMIGKVLSKVKNKEVDGSQTESTAEGQEEQSPAVKNTIKYAKTIFQAQNMEGRGQFIAKVLEIVEKSVGKTTDPTENQDQKPVFNGVFIDVSKDENGVIQDPNAVFKGVFKDLIEIGRLAVNATLQSTPAERQEAIKGIVKSKAEVLFKLLQSGDIDGVIAQIKQQIKLPTYIEGIIDEQLKQLPIAEIFEVLQPFIAGMQQEDLEDLIDLLPAEVFADASNKLHDSIQAGGYGKTHPSEFVKQILNDKCQNLAEKMLDEKRDALMILETGNKNAYMKRLEAADIPESGRVRLRQLWEAFHDPHSSHYFIRQEVVEVLNSVNEQATNDQKKPAVEQLKALFIPHKHSLKETTKETSRFMQAFDLLLTPVESLTSSDSNEAGLRQLLTEFTVQDSIHDGIKQAFGEPQESAGSISSESVSPTPNEPALEQQVPPPSQAAGAAEESDDEALREPFPAPLPSEVVIGSQALESSQSDYKLRVKLIDEFLKQYQATLPAQSDRSEDPAAPPVTTSADWSKITLPTQSNSVETSTEASGRVDKKTPINQMWVGQTVAANQTADAAETTETTKDHYDKIQDALWSFTGDAVKASSRTINVNSKGRFVGTLLDDGGHVDRQGIIHVGGGRETILEEMIIGLQQLKQDDFDQSHEAALPPNEAGIELTSFFSEPIAGLSDITREEVQIYLSANKEMKALNRQEELLDEKISHLNKVLASLDRPEQDSAVNAQKQQLNEKISKLQQAKTGLRDQISAEQLKLDSLGEDKQLAIAGVETALDQKVEETNQASRTEMRKAVKTYFPFFANIFAMPDFRQHLETLFKDADIPSDMRNMMISLINQLLDPKSPDTQKIEKPLLLAMQAIANPKNEKDKGLVNDLVEKLIPDEALDAFSDRITSILNNLIPQTQLDFFSDFSKDLVGSLGEITTVQDIAEQLTANYYQSIPIHDKRAFAVAVLEYGKPEKVNGDLTPKALGSLIGRISQAARAGYQKGMQLFSGDIIDIAIRKELTEMKSDVEPMSDEVRDYMIDQEITKINEQNRLKAANARARLDRHNNPAFGLPPLSAAEKIELERATVWEEISVLKEQFGDVGAKKDFESLGSATIACSYKAKIQYVQNHSLHPTGGHLGHSIPPREETVVMKVMRPNVDQWVRQEMNSLCHIPGLAPHVKKTLESLRDSILEETNFIYEATYNDLVVELFKAESKHHHDESASPIKVDTAACLHKSNNLLIQKVAPGTQVGKNYEAMMEKLESQYEEFQTTSHAEHRNELAKDLVKQITDMAEHYYVTGEQIDLVTQNWIRAAIVGDPSDKVLKCPDWYQAVRIVPGDSSGASATTQSAFSNDAKRVIEYQRLDSVTDITQARFEIRVFDHDAKCTRYFTDAQDKTREEQKIKAKLEQIDNRLIAAQDADKIALQQEKEALTRIEFKVVPSDSSGQLTKELAQDDGTLGSYQLEPKKINELLKHEPFVGGGLIEGDRHDGNALQFDANSDIAKKQNKARVKGDSIPADSTKNTDERVQNLMTLIDTGAVTVLRKEERLGLLEIAAGIFTGEASYVVDGLEKMNMTIDSSKRDNVHAEIKDLIGATPTRREIAKDVHDAMRAVGAIPLADPSDQVEVFTSFEKFRSEVNRKAKSLDQQARAKQTGASGGVGAVAEASDENGLSEVEYSESKSRVLVFQEAAPNGATSRGVVILGHDGRILWPSASELANNGTELISEADKDQLVSLFTSKMSLDGLSDHDSRRKNNVLNDLDKHLDNACSMKSTAEEVRASIGTLTREILGLPLQNYKQRLEDFINATSGSEWQQTVDAFAQTGLDFWNSRLASTAESVKEARAEQLPKIEALANAFLRVEGFAELTDKEIQIDVKRYKNTRNNQQNKAFLQRVGQLDYSRVLGNPYAHHAPTPYDELPPGARGGQMADSSNQAGSGWLEALPEALLFNAISDENNCAHLIKTIQRIANVLSANGVDAPTPIVQLNRGEKFLRDQVLLNNARKKELESLLKRVVDSLDKDGALVPGQNELQPAQVAQLQDILTHKRGQFSEKIMGNVIRKGLIGELKRESATSMVNQDTRLFDDLLAVVGPGVNKQLDNPWVKAVAYAGRVAYPAYSYGVAPFVRKGVAYGEPVYNNVVAPAARAVASVPRSFWYGGSGLLGLGSLASMMPSVEAVSSIASEAGGNLLGMVESVDPTTAAAIGSMAAVGVGAYYGWNAMMGGRNTAQPDNQLTANGLPSGSSPDDVDLTDVRTSPDADGTATNIARHSAPANDSNHTQNLERQVAQGRLASEERLFA